MVFLITTADQRFWKKDEKILFLGEWCKIYSEKNIWQGLNYEVAPYHWNDKTKLERDRLYIDKLYEKYLKILANNLNIIHGVSYSVRYWRIVIGPWLHHFLLILFDRYESIKRVYINYELSNVWVGQYDYNCWVPQDLDQYRFWFVGDEYNNYLFAKIINFLSIPCVDIQVKVSPPSSPIIRNKFKTYFKKNIRYFFRFLMKVLLKPFVKYIFCFEHLNLSALIKLTTYLRQPPVLMGISLTHINVKPDLTLRDKSAFSQAECEFEGLVNCLLPQQLPTAYLEAYGIYSNVAKSFIAKPKAIITDVGQIACEKFKFWAASKVEMGTKLIVTQHGGVYGSAKYSDYEQHEIKIADAYFTWGWQSPSHNAIPVSSLKLMGSVSKISHNPNGYILYADTAFPRYSYCMRTGYMGPQVLDHLIEQHMWYSLLLKPIQDKLLLRLHISDYNWDVRRRWLDLNPAIHMSDLTNDFCQDLSGARLFIGTNNATTYLETLAANFPTIVFWNPHYWELRPEAEPLFAELRHVGILHDTPVAAAAMVNKIYEDPLLWWKTDEVQAARSRFCHSFARLNENWLEEWKQMLAHSIKEIKS